MQKLLKDHDQASLFADLFCDADLITPLITREEKAMVRERCSGSGLNIIDCHCFDLQQYINDAGGLDINSKIITNATPLIQQDIVVIPREWFDHPADSIESNIVGIRLGDILSHPPRQRWGCYELSDEVHIDLSALNRPVFRGKRVILFASGIDTVIEKLWWLRDPIQLFQEIAKGNFFAVTGMNFSLFLHECPLGQLINLNKSLLFSAELSCMRVPVIPHIYAVNDPQRSRCIEYLSHNPAINTVTINTQLQKDKYSIREVVKTVNELIENTHVNIVLNGYTPKGLSNSLGSRVFIANQHGLKRDAIIERASTSIVPLT